MIRSAILLTTTNLKERGNQWRVKIQLSRKTACLLLQQFLQGSGTTSVCTVALAFPMIPAIKKLYPNKDQVQLLSATLSSTTLTLMFLH